MDAWVDLADGAAHFGLRQSVNLQRQVLVDYTEADAVMGLNVIGAILSRLVWRHTRSIPESSDVITVELRRRSDGQLVEVYLEIRSLRRGGCDSLHLRIAGEQVAAKPATPVVSELSPPEPAGPPAGEQEGKPSVANAPCN